MDAFLHKFYHQNRRRKVKRLFGIRADGQPAYLYTITCGDLTAEISDHGAAIHKLLAPDAKGILADVILGFNHPDDYSASTTFFGAPVGRFTNRIANGEFYLGGEKICLDRNDNNTSYLHGGFEPYKNRLWQVPAHTQNSICFQLESPHGDQGFPGNAVIKVTYTLEPNNTLRISYDAVSDRDTVFNMTNHSLFNMAGHDHPEKAMSQLLTMPARIYTPSNEHHIPTGEERSVEGTPMDFRVPKAIGKDLGEDYLCLKLQKGYDHNFEVFCNPCAILTDPDSGRTMAISTDCPGLHFYCGNYLSGEKGKDGVRYCYRGGVALETQFYPDCVNKPQWMQPITKAGERYHSVTSYRFF